MNQYPSKGFTHAGKFHADDAFSTALLKYLNKDFTYTRGYQVPEDFDGIVYDIGWGEFDHHQADARVRDNGVPYAAFGLLWEKFGADIVGEEEAAHIDELFVQPLDKSDNTGEYNEVSRIIESFNPVWDSKYSEDEAFKEVVDMAYRILEHKFEQIFSVRRAEEMVEKALEKAEDKILILPCNLPWKQRVVREDIEYVVYPSRRGGYAAQGVPPTVDSSDTKRPFPKEWCGATAKELADMTGIEGFRFCHKSGFLLTAQTKEEAVECCKLSQQMSKE